MNCKHVSYHFIPLLFSGLSFLAHGQGQPEGAQLLVIWKAGAHFRVCDSVPPIDLQGNSLEWNAKTGGVWEANPREDGRTVLSVSTRERPDCSGAISETGQFYPALSSRDSLPESKLPDDIRALMLRLSHRKPQDKQSDSSKSSTSSWLPLGDFGKKATAAAPALLALGGWGGFFNQFPPRPPFPGFPGQESKSLATSTTVMLLLLVAQGLLPFPDDSQQSFIFIDINGDSVALNQDDLQWLERFRQNPDFHSLLDIRVKETLFPGAEYEYEQYEAEQRKRQAMLTLAVWLTKMEVALNYSMDSLETDESDIVKPERPADTSSTSERTLPGIISMMFSSKRTSPPDTQGESGSSGSQSHTSSGLPQRRPNSVNRDDAGDDGASPPKINLACPSCSQSFPTELDLKAHIKSEHGEAENIERHGVSVPLKTMEVAAVDEQPKPKKKKVVSLSIPRGVLDSVSYMDANDRKSYVVEIQPADSVVQHGQLVTTDPKIAKSILISKMVDGVRKALKTYESNPSDKTANRLKEDIAYWEEVHANELSDDVQVQTFLNVLHKLVINIATFETDQKSEYEDDSICTPFISSMHPGQYSAKIINQETREGDTHTSKEVVLKLFENDRFKNVNAAHWQEKLTELESALKLGGIRSGTRPDPEKHKFDRKVKGSDLFYYRNAAVKVEESIDDSVLDLYQKKQDPVTNITYYCVKPEFAQGQENTMPVILEGEFASIPVEHRHNPLAGIHPDYMSQVDLNPVLKPHHASNKGFELRNNSSAKVRLPNLPLDQEIAFMNTLQGVNKYFPDMSEEQLKRLLLNPETGDYQELDRRCLPTMIIVNYLTLQQADPKCFTDQGFYWASRLRQFTCYGEGYIPEGKAHELWLKETRNAVVTDMAVRKQLEHINLTSLLPEGRDFERFKQRLKGVKIPEDMLDDYKNNIREEAYLYLFHFGGPLGKDQCDQIFRDCTQKLVEQLDPEEDANKSNEHYKIYNSMTFDWFDRNLHEKYKAHQSPGFVAYQDGDATSQYASRFKDEDNPKLANKFRISIHPHDYKKAWDIVAKVLCENESPFLQWKAIPPWKTKVGIEQSRLKIGGQFTLYSVDSEESKDVERFKPAQTARVLQQIEQELKSRRIRPGIQPRSDIDLGPDHPFLSYRYDMDKENKYYQPAVLVGHQRRIEYRQMPRYQDVFQILNQ